MAENIFRSRENPSSRQGVFLVGIAIAFFSALRIAAAFDEFYIDEIWSLYFAVNAASPLDLITKVKHDNNHILNTLFLMAIGKPAISGIADFFLYRLFSVVSGGVSLVLVARIAWKRFGFPASFAAVALAGASYPLINYSAEARGYSPAIMFSLFAFISLQSYLKKRSLYLLPLFWGAASLSLLSHMSAIYIYAALLAWSVFHEFFHADGEKSVAGLVKCHAIPAFSAAFLYFYFARHMVLGGGAKESIFEAVSQAFVLAVGSPAVFLPWVLAVLAALAAVGAGVFVIRASSEWVFYACAVFIAPAVVIAIMRPDIIYMRYFLVAFPFFYLLCSFALCSIWGKFWGKALFALVIILFITGNAYSLLKFFGNGGRGEYLEAMGMMARNTPGKTIAVSSDHDFRNKIVLEFYSGFLKDKSVRYIGFDDAYPSDWHIIHSMDPDSKPVETAYNNGAAYGFAGEYRHRGLSGWSWFLYKRKF